MNKPGISTEGVKFVCCILVETVNVSVLRPAKMITN